MHYKIKSKQSGVTLIELVATIALMSILGAGVANFMSGPIRQYLIIAERATAASVGDQAMRVFTRDARHAIPNTARIKSDGRTLEFLHMAAGHMYRKGSPTDQEGLTFGGLFQNNVGDRYFRVLGVFDDELIGDHPKWRAVVSPLPVYEQGDMDKPAAGVNVYGKAGRWNRDVIVVGQNDEGKRVISAAEVNHWGHAISGPGVSIARGDEPHTFDLDEEGWLPDTPRSQDIVKLTTPHTFAAHSSAQRVYFMDTPVTYHCDLSKGQLLKYWDYSLSSEQPVPGTDNPPLNAKPGVAGAIVADRVKKCKFEFGQDLGINYSLILLTLELEGRSGESVILTQQVHIRNDA